MRRVFGMLSISVVLMLVVVGCNGGGDAGLPDLVPVSGTVTLDGEPCSGVGVSFLPHRYDHRQRLLGQQRR